MQCFGTQKTRYAWTHVQEHAGDDWHYTQMTHHSVTVAELWQDNGQLQQLKQLQHLQLSSNCPAPPADGRKTEDALITGGERETSLEELNKLTNPVWNPVTSSSSAQNINYSILMTHALHRGESVEPWIREESLNIRSGLWTGCHCRYHHCRPPVAWHQECSAWKKGLCFKATEFRLSKININTPNILMSLAINNLQKCAWLHLLMCALFLQQNCMQLTPILCILPH